MMRRIHTGPSPKSFSGFWNDILTLLVRLETGGVIEGCAIVSDWAFE